MKLSNKVKKEVTSIAGGLYSLNAPNAAYYAFNVKDNEVFSGEFLNYLNPETAYGYDYCYNIGNGLYSKLEG